MAALRQGRGGMPEYLAVSWAQRMQTCLPPGWPGRPGSAPPLPRTRTRFTVSGTVREQDHGCEGVAAMAVQKTVPAAKAPARKTAAKKAPAKKAAATKAAAAKTVAKKTAAKKTAVRKAPAKKT